MTPLLTYEPPLTHTFFGRLVGTSRRVHEAADFVDFAGEQWAERIMSEVIRDQFHEKQGRTISRWTLTAADGRTLTVYLKRHYVLPRVKGLLAAMFPRRAWSTGLQEWEHLEWAKSVGIPVPRPIAAGELRGPWGQLQSFLAVEELTGMLPLHEAIPLASERLNSSDFARWKSRLVVEIAQLARELHRRRTFHKDCYLCHFYLLRDDCLRVPETFRLQIAMIDFHRLARHRIGVRWYQVKDLAQLLFSTVGVDGITDRDRLRFWKHYRNGDWTGSTSPRGWIRHAVERKCRLYDRHNRRKQARTASKS